jgi:hypothetical protein
LVENIRSVGNRHVLVLVISEWPEKQLTDSLSVGKSSFGLNDFAKLAVVPFHGIGGVNQAADLGRKAKVSG